MTPKEKAKEIVKSMYGNIFDGGQYEDAEDAWYRSKQCALIAVDEILKANPYEVSKTDMDSTIDYWMEVKQEIENL